MIRFLELRQAGLTFRLVDASPFANRERNPAGRITGRQSK
jgi:hypothetical protein